MGTERCSTVHRETEPGAAPARADTLANGDVSCLFERLCVLGENGIRDSDAITREAEFDILYGRKHRAELESRRMVNPLIEPAHATFRAATRSRFHTSAQSRLAANATAAAMLPAVSATHSTGIAHAQNIKSRSGTSIANVTHRARRGE